MASENSFKIYIEADFSYCVSFISLENNQVYIGASRFFNERFCGDDDIAFGSTAGCLGLISRAGWAQRLIFHDVWNCFTPKAKEPPKLLKPSLCVCVCVVLGTPRVCAHV